MASRMLFLKNKVTNTIFHLKTKSGNIQLPERIKGTIIEKWANYWKLLGADYKEAGTNFIQEAKSKPIKTSIYTSIGIAAYACIKRNPSEIDFMERLRTYSNEMGLVHDSCHNTDSSSHLIFTERCLNEGVLRRLSLGLLSFMWVADYDKFVAVYKAICPHLQLEYSKFKNRIVDIGFWNKWWKLENKMLNYDVEL